MPRLGHSPQEQLVQPISFYLCAFCSFVRFLLFSRHFLRRVLKISYRVFWEGFGGLFGGIWRVIWRSFEGNIPYEIVIKKM